MFRLLQKHQEVKDFINYKYNNIFMKPYSIILIQNIVFQLV